MAYLDLTVTPVIDGHPWRVPGILQGVHLEMHGETLDALLGAEVRAETLDGDVDLGRALHGVPVDCQGVVTDLLYHACQTCRRIEQLQYFSLYR